MALRIRNARGEWVTGWEEDAFHHVFVYFCLSTKVKIQMQIGEQPDVRCQLRTPLKIKTKKIVHQIHDTSKFHRLEEIKDRVLCYDTQIRVLIFF